MRTENVTSVVVAIDTTDYSGNFERPMCAYVTGQIGECEVGSGLAAIANSEIDENLLDWMEEHIVQESDDKGCHRPCAIWPTPVRPVPRKFSRSAAYESVAIFFDEVPAQEIIDLIIVRAKEFAANRPDRSSYQGKKTPLTITRIRVLEPKLVKPRQIDHVEIARHEM